MDDVERWAKEVLETHLGVKVLLADTGARPGICDFDLEAHGVVCGAAEVTRVTHPEGLRLLDALRRHGNTANSDVVRERWIVGLLDDPSSPERRFRDVRRELGRALAEVERAGVRFFTRIDGLWCPAVARVCSEFPVWKGASLGPADQPRLLFERPHPVPYLAPDPLRLNRAVEREASKRDVRAKLGRTSYERHLFVKIEEQAFALWMEFCTSEFSPGDPVRLPPEVDVVWLGAQWNPHQRVVWRANRGELWEVIEGVGSVVAGAVASDP